MKKNTLLSIAIVICKFIRVLYVLIFLIFAGFFVHLQINPSYYNKIGLSNKLDFKNNSFVTSYKVSNGIHINTRRTYKYEGEQKDSDVFTLDQLKKTSLYFSFIKYSVVLFLGFLCFGEFQKVMESVKEVKTFQENNVLSFRRIGKYLLIICVLTSFYYHAFQRGGINGVNITPNLLILSLLAYIMAEVFKEGNNLEEENKLTV
ncbi:DUF2975 domain-containing protein [Wenyingzhuangia sp. chi5]|uniref:DUF2975 domain-containing protein n=1 Tax=Wenyingzhuangia gilva TaxID=3057677 RepID=A0ABT8VQU9_9FLAO|nr:DUF2975 domain-containing protein [Wenyingzhuangia sp. chi5]MDO3694342.1 DUF2975 domain-containing protein [Wenyingzhuangia sp. chi5]